MSSGRLARPSGATDEPGGASRSAPPGRVPALDGLRGLALVAVLAYHAAPGILPGGFLGVESFFVLSGFLLTSLLVTEHRRTGTIARGPYAGRRLRRSAPGLVALLAALVVVVPVVAGDDAHRLAGDVFASLLGLTNWHLVADASSYFDQAGRPSFVRHLWSVAIEVQFYVLCPFLAAWLVRHRRKAALAALGGGVAASALAMALLYDGDDPSRAYFGTEARVGALLSGALLALALTGTGARRLAAPRAHRAVALLGTVSLAALSALYLLADDRARWAYPSVFLATQAATAGLVVAALYAGPVRTMLSSEKLRWLGVRSFGIYLWHWPAVILLRPGIDVDWSPFVAGTVGVAAAVALGALSYRFVERPLLRPRPRPLPVQRRRALALAMTLGTVGLTGVLLNLPTTNPVAETLRVGEGILAAQADPTIAGPASDGVTMLPFLPKVAPLTPAPVPQAPDPEAGSSPETAPPPTDTAPLPSETAPPPAEEEPAAPDTVPVGVTVRAVGDSVMVSATGALEARLGPSGYIDAELNRQFADGIAVARGIREQGGAGVVVVHLGNNGPVEAADVDALMAELVDVPTVLLVNVRVSAPWRDSVNQTLADAAGRHPRIRLVDWYAASEGHADWFQSDGTHFRTTSGPGANAFADLIVASIPPPPA